MNSCRSFLPRPARAKEQFKPGVITYSRKVFLPLTNLCRDYCGYCVFRQDPGDPGAHTMTPDEVLAVVRHGEKLGCTEALFSLGDKPELLFPGDARDACAISATSTLHYLEAMCELVLRESTLLPHPNPGIAECGVDCAARRGLPEHGTDAGDHERRPARPRRGARQRSRQTSCEALAHDRRRGQAGRSLHHRDC